MAAPCPDPAPFTTTPNGKDLAALAQMIEAGQVAPGVSCTVPFAAIPAALGDAAQGHTRGKVVVIIREHGAQP